ncbi:hypothetical protein Hdeb2414_s0025g00669261 [Helianthus debilis subsp. tardiflorus]
MSVANPFNLGLVLLVDMRYFVIKKLRVRGLFTRELALLIMMIGTLTGAQWGIYMLSMCLLGCCPHLCKKLSSFSPFNF